MEVRTAAALRHLSPYLQSTDLYLSSVIRSDRRINLNDPQLVAYCDYFHLEDEKGEFQGEVRRLTMVRNSSVEDEKYVYPQGTEHRIRPNKTNYHTSACVRESVVGAKRGRCICLEHDGMQPI